MAGRATGPGTTRPWLPSQRKRRRNEFCTQRVQNWRSG